MATIGEVNLEELLDTEDKYARGTLLIVELGGSRKRHQ